MRVARDLGVVVEAGGAPLDLVEVLDARLAALEREQLGEARAVFAHQARGVVEELGALDGRMLAPLAPCPAAAQAGARRPRRLPSTTSSTTSSVAGFWIRRTFPLPWAPGTHSPSIQSFFMRNYLS